MPSLDEIADNQNSKIDSGPSPDELVAGYH
jgi:hypothetical protein